MPIVFIDNMHGRATFSKKEFLSFTESLYAQFRQSEDFETSSYLDIFGIQRTRSMCQNSTGNFEERHKDFLSHGAYGNMDMENTAIQSLLQDSDDECSKEKNKHDSFGDADSVAPFVDI